MVKYLLSLIYGQVGAAIITRIECRRIRLLVALHIHEEEQFVLDKSARHVATIGERVLSCQWVLLAKLLVPTAIEILIVVVGISRRVKRVATLLSHRIDATTGEARLAHVEWRDHHLQFLDGFKRDRIHRSLTAICAGCR